MAAGSAAGAAAGGRAAGVGGSSIFKAFSIEPDSFGELDWLCSDVIAYPKRMYALVERWHRSGNVRNMIVSMKFQGETDHEIARAFASIEGSQLFHLHHNRHELTFALLRD